MRWKRGRWGIERGRWGRRLVFFGFWGFEVLVLWVLVWFCGFIVSFGRGLGWFVAFKIFGRKRGRVYGWWRREKGEDVMKHFGVQGIEEFTDIFVFRGLRNAPSKRQKQFLGP